MKIRDAHATLNGDEIEYTMPSGSLQIVADDGHTLFELGLTKGGVLEVRAGHHCKHAGKVFEDQFRIIPSAANVFYVEKVEYKP